ncbi:MAG: hypothetical protein Kow0092_37970 [Deferrisomatales bacterium]
MHIREQIAGFLVNEPDLAPGRDAVEFDEPLIDGGLIDSMGILKLIAFLEEAFDAVLDDDDITAENFATISTIAELVRARAATAQAG